MNKTNSWIVAVIVAAMFAGTATAQLRISPTTKWETVSDQMMGGKSSMRATAIGRVAGSLPGIIEIEGRLLPGFIYPFAKIVAPFSKGGAPEDARKYAGVQFWVRGDGHQYFLQVLTAAVADYNYFNKDFKTSKRWTLVKVPFNSLRQTIPNGKQVPWTGKDVTGIGVEAGGFVGPFELEIRDVSLYH